MYMAYQKINVELIVFEEEADAMVAELDSALDRLEERYTLFGGPIEAVPVEHSNKKEIGIAAHPRCWKYGNICG